MTRAAKLFPGAIPEYIEFADEFFAKADFVRYSEDDFWDMIGECRRQLDSIPIDPYEKHSFPVFRSAISKLSTEQLYYAEKHFTRMFIQLYRREIWSAISFIHGGCSDDSFMDFRQWLMTCGRDPCVSMVEDADNLPAIISQYKRTTLFSEGVISYGITNEFEARTGFEIPSEDRVCELQGEWIDEDSVPTKLPNCYLFKQQASQPQR